MKNIKFILLLAGLCTLQLGWSQQNQVLDNGRNSKATPQQAVEQNQATSAEQFNGSDQDVPGQWKQSADQEDLTFPADLETLREELNVSASPRQVIERVNAMSEKMEALLLANEELRRENEVIRKSLQSCCNSSNLEAEDAYLLQNSPNPVVDQSQIRYFVPENMTDARVEIADLKGIVLQSLELEQFGLNQVNVDTQSLGTGNYIYTLYVDGKIVDSRIMIVTK
ncbi:MAG: T9SS type A sorting domain-containing protein [Bacteroidota bacterium]